MVKSGKNFAISDNSSSNNITASKSTGINLKAGKNKINATTNSSSPISGSDNEIVSINEEEDGLSLDEELVVVSRRGEDIRIIGFEFKIFKSTICCPILILITNRFFHDFLLYA